MKTIGLTGGIGSGKSTAAQILEELGAALIDADRVGHDVYRPGTEGWKKVTETFGQDVVASDGSIDRKRLGAIVFADPAALKRLTAIVHPLIAQEVATRIERLRTAGTHKVIVVEAAVLIEANWQSLVDEVWLVAAGKSAIVERLQAQRGVTAADIEARIAAQLSDDERRCHADLVIENGGSIDELRSKLREAWTRLLSRAE